jgi:hypothetical protein
MIMARPMYGLLATTPFQIPIDPGSVAIYYPPPVAIIDAQGAPVLDVAGLRTYYAQPTIERAAQATIDAQFKRAKNYYDSYLNIRRAVFNILDDNIDDAFKVSNDPALVGCNQSMEPREMFNQITATYGKPTPAALLQNDTFSKACIPRTTPPKYCSGTLKIVKKYRF